MKQALSSFISNVCAVTSKPRRKAPAKIPNGSHKPRPHGRNMSSLGSAWLHELFETGFYFPWRRREGQNIKMILACAFPGSNEQTERVLVEMLPLGLGELRASFSFCHFPALNNVNI